MDFRSNHDDGPLISPISLGHSPPPIRTSAFSKPPASSHNGLLISPTTPAATSNYRECLKNHAASIGGHVLDGCGEFMPNEDDSLKCAACACHRSFHRKASDAASAPLPLILPPPPLHSYRNHQKLFGFQPSLSGGTTTDSSSEEQMEVADIAQPSYLVVAASRKRFRTTFTAEQKEKMLGFAERVGWRLQKQYENAIEEFCNEIGVRRKVFKVWMHNNKHSVRRQQVLIQNQPHEQLEHLCLQQREQ